MPSESDKWRDRATIFKPSETAEIKAVSDPEESDAEYWMSESSLWKPLKRAYSRAASVSDIYDYFLQESTGLRFSLVKAGPLPKVVREKEDQVGRTFRLTHVDVKDASTEYNIAPELIGRSFALTTVAVNEIVKGLTPEDVGLSFRLVDIQLIDGVTYRIPEESVGLSFSLTTVELRRDQ